MLKRLRELDPRYFQITTLTSLLLYGLFVLHFDATVGGSAICIIAALGAQWCWTRVTAMPHFDPKSALISALSLSLLLRAAEPALLAVAAILAVSSKFMLRDGKKHIFNPTNFAIVALLLTTDRVWVSPGQWGNAAFFGFALGAAGLFVVYRSCRSDITIVFLLAYATLLLGRALYLGDPLTIPFHKLQSGALILFAFFMISDPRSTPDSRSGRAFFAIAAAAGGWWIQTKLFRSEGLLYALAATSLLTPLLDRISPDARFEWPSFLRPRTASQSVPSNVIALSTRSLS